MSAVATPDITSGRERHTPGYPIAWWGMVALIATEAMIFAALLSAYFFVRSGSSEWPQGGIAPPDLGRIGIFTVVLVGSSLPVFWAEAGIKRGHVGQLRVGLLISFLMGAAFLVNQLIDFSELDFRAGDNAYGSLFITITGLHGLHVVAGLVICLIVQLKARLGYFDAEHHVTVSVFSLYWHFVDAVWIAVFTSLYLSVHVR
jgi:heme/copper-type cytochrome/quinol oxidase subunit 3